MTTADTALSLACNGVGFFAALWSIACAAVGVRTIKTAWVNRAKNNGPMTIAFAPKIDHNR